MIDTVMHFYLTQDHVLQQTASVLIDMVKVVGVISIATQLGTAVLTLPRPVSHVSAKCQESVKRGIQNNRIAE